MKVRTHGSGNRQRLGAVAVQTDRIDGRGQRLARGRYNCTLRHHSGHALSGFDGTMLFVSHDRTFLRGMANRVLDLSGGGEGVSRKPLVFQGSYEEWVERTGHEAPGVWH